MFYHMKSGYFRLLDEVRELLWPVGEISKSAITSFVITLHEFNFCSLLAYHLLIGLFSLIFLSTCTRNKGRTYVHAIVLMLPFSDILKSWENETINNFTQRIQVMEILDDYIKTAISTGSEINGVQALLSIANIFKKLDKVTFVPQASS